MKTFSLITRLMIISVIITFTIAQPTIVRCCHSSTVANDKLYIGGGVTGPVGNDIWTNDFFSLDLTKPFSTSSPNDIPYEVHSKVPVKSMSHTLVYAKNAKGGMIYLFGGHRQPPEGDPVYGYDLEINAWSSITPVRDGVIMPVNSTSRVIGVTDSNLGIIYVFDNGAMFIYDVLHNYLDVGNPAPFKLYNYAAVMLNTGEIAYIGGSNGTANVPMEQILLYNTNLSSWYIKTAIATSSNIPSPRQGHTASIAPDGRIFIYGGFNTDDNAVTPVGSNPTFAVLEYINDEFEWFTPQIFNQSYVTRIFHTSHVVGNYLIVAFGRNLTHSPSNSIDLINIKDRDDYTVTKDFVPENFVSTTSSKLKFNLIMLISAIGVAVFLVIVGGCVIWKCYRNRRIEVIPTPGENRERNTDNYLSSTPSSIYEGNSTYSTYVIHDKDIDSARELPFIFQMPKDNGPIKGY